jgi:RNA polymerase sigma-B factor
MVTITVDDTASLLRGFGQAGETQARDRLVSNYMPLVHSIANRFRRSREPQEDLVQIGVVGLLNAIVKFDPRRGAKFASLAVPEVRGAILNHLRDHGSLMKAPRDLRHNRIAVAKASDMLAACLGRLPTVTELADQCGLSENEVDESLKFARTIDARSLDATIQPGAEDRDATALEFLGSEDREYEASLDRITLEAAIDALPLREKTIITLKFYRGMTQRQIAKRIALSQMHVSRLERRALARLRSLVRGEEAQGRERIAEPAFRNSALPAAS